MITAFPVLQPTVTAMADADGYVTKPVKPADLIGLVTSLIERSRRSGEQSADGNPATGIF